MIKKILITTVVIIVLLITIFAYGFRSATKLPDNDPRAFLASKSTGKGKVVVCIGDSITHGRVSHNYVNDLAMKFPADTYSFVNAGINSELAYNVLQRIDEIIKCHPDYITLLIGTNDVLATLNMKNADRYIKEMDLPQKPDINWYRDNLAAIISRLQIETNARIAILSLPPITEDLNHVGYKKSIKYSAIIREIAREKNLAYLPINETMVEDIRRHPDSKKSRYEGGDRGDLYTAIISYYLLGRDWDDIANRNGFLYMTDSIHLNRRGAMIVANFIAGFLQDQPAN